MATVRQPVPRSPGDRLAAGSPVRPGDRHALAVLLLALPAPHLLQGLSRTEVAAFPAAQGSRAADHSKRQQTHVVVEERAARTGKDSARACVRRLRPAGAWHPDPTRTVLCFPLGITSPCRERAAGGRG